MVTNTVVARFTVLDHDDITTDNATTALARELRRLHGVESLRRAPADGAEPGGARVGELVDLAALLAVLTAHQELVTGVLSGVVQWLGRRGRGRIEIRIGEDELILDAATAEQQRQLTDAFIERVLRP